MLKSASECVKVYIAMKVNILAFSSNLGLEVCCKFPCLQHRKDRPFAIVFVIQRWPAYEEIF